MSPRLAFRWRAPQRGDNLPLPVGAIPPGTIHVAAIPGPAYDGRAQVIVAPSVTDEGYPGPMQLSVVLPGGVCAFHLRLTTFSPLIARCMAGVLVAAHLKTLGLEAVSRETEPLSPDLRPTP